jgi:hypothetical protein
MSLLCILFLSLKMGVTRAGPEVKPTILKVERERWFIQF